MESWQGTPCFCCADHESFVRLCLDPYTSDFIMTNTIVLKIHATFYLLTCILAASGRDYRVSLRSLAESSVAAGGGPREGEHSGENCILVYNAKAVPPPVSGSCEPYFRPNSVSC